MSGEKTSTCSHCGAPVPINAAQCPYCDSKTDKQIKKQERKDFALGCLVLCLAILGLFSLLGKACSP